MTATCNLDEPFAGEIHPYAPNHAPEKGHNGHEPA